MSGGPVTLAATPTEKQIYAKTLLDMGVPIRQVMRKLKMGPNTVISIKRSQMYSPQILDEFKRRLPYKSYKWADDVLDIISVDEVKKAPLGTKVMLYGVAIDKARDMEGSNRPIFNLVSVVNDTQRTIQRLNADLDSIRNSSAITEQKALTDHSQP